ncbi:hypothetical protein M758_UG220800 [Ceratodon purpureus]|nr:hypothetical protein M758_UG220800 [Ceratodon purpureus]
MEEQEGVATPTGEFRAIDDTGTFDRGSAVQNRKRRRSSLRRVSFAEQPLIHVFARDDDYETPPEGTMSHLSAQSTPTSVSRSPQRRSERLAAARGGWQDENQVDKENAAVSVGSNARQSRRGRRPLALRNVQKETEEEFLKPSNWLDDHENSAFGSCDDNSGPVDIRHITFDNQRAELDDDDNMTMDSQVFHTRMSLMKQQSLTRLPEASITPGMLSDMESIHGQHTERLEAWHERHAVGNRVRQVQEEPTWHRGDGRVSDMSESSFDELSIIRVLAKKRSAAKELSIVESADNASEGRDHWVEDDARSQGKLRDVEIRSGPLLDMDDAVSMDTSSPQSMGGRRKSFADEREQVSEMRSLHSSEGLDGTQLQGMQSSKLQGQSEFQVTRPITKKGALMFDYDCTVAMEASSQSHGVGNDSTMEIDLGTDERLSMLGKQRSVILKESEATVPEHTARESIRQAAEHSAPLDIDNVALNPSVTSGASEDSPMPLKQYERKLKRMSTTSAVKDIPVTSVPRMDFKSQLSSSRGHVQLLSEESPVRQRIDRYGQGSDRQESPSEHRMGNKESRKPNSLQVRDGFVSPGIEPETLLSAPDENIESMDITRAWNERELQHTSVPTKSSDSAKSFVWLNKDQSMDMSDVDMMEKYQEGITEAMPKLAFVMGGYNCDSPSAEPLNRILQRKSGNDGEDSPVHGVTAEINTEGALSSRKGDDVARNGVLEERETVSNPGLDEGTDGLHFSFGRKRAGFQNPEDTFSFRGHQKNTRETSVSPSMEQNVMPKPIVSKVRERVNIIEANLRNQCAPHNPERDFQDEDTTAEYTDQHDWRAEVCSDMSTTPLSPRPSYFQRLGTKSQTVPALSETGLTDSPSFEDGITAAIPNVQDLLAADARTPESELGWNLRKIDWSTQISTRQDSGDQEGLLQPGTNQMEDETMHSMPDKLCTPIAQADKNDTFEYMTEEAANTLNQVSHTKEVRNSVARKMLLRMLSLKEDARAQAESSSDVESQQSLRRTLQFQPESDSQLQSQSSRRDADHQISAEDLDGTMGVDSAENADKETNSTESKLETLRQESRRQKLLQEMQVAQERLVALERRSEELRERAHDCHKAIAKRCWNDSCSKTNESAAFCSQAHVSELKKQCQLLNCMLGWDLETTKTGANQVLHEFRYWSLLTYSIFEQKEEKFEATISRSSICLNEESINQVYRHMNASLVWRWFLSRNEEATQLRSLFYHAQDVHFKVVMLTDLMEEVNKCRKYLVVPHFQIQSGTGLHLGLQFADSELLFDFLLLLDMKQVSHMRYSKGHELNCATEVNQKLDCILEMESAGRSVGTKITEAEIKSALASVVPGRHLVLRVCASINALIIRKKESVS